MNTDQQTHIVFALVVVYKNWHSTINGKLLTAILFYMHQYNNNYYNYNCSL